MANKYRQCSLLFAIVTCAFCSVPKVACWAQNAQVENLLFDNFEGTFVSSKQNSITIRTSDGDKVFRVAKSDEDLPQLGVGRGTAISVRGIEGTSFLKTGMTIRFVGELDKVGKSGKPLESIEVLSLSAKLETAKEQIPLPDPQSGLASYRITGRIHSIDHQSKRLAVTLRNGGKSDRYEFAIDLEKTRVIYDLPNLSLAQPGETVQVRCLPSSGANQIASEVRVTRPSPFANDVNQGEAGTSVPRSDGNPPADPDAPVQTAESDGSDDGDEGMQKDPSADSETNEVEGTDSASKKAARPDDVVAFDFARTVPSESGIDLGLLKLLLGIEMAEPQPAVAEVPIGHKKLEGRSARRSTPAGRGWFKIN